LAGLARSAGALFTGNANMTGTKKDSFLFPQPDNAVFDLLYAKARSDSVILLGSVQSSKKYPDPHPAPFAPIMKRDLNDTLPGMQEYLLNQTHYLKPNTLKTSALIKQKNLVKNKNDDNYNPGLAAAIYQEQAMRGNAQYVLTTENQTRELIAITIDLDVGRADDQLSAAQALSLVFYKTITGEFPIPSLAAFSGRGAYLTYLLLDEKDGLAPLATPDAIHSWKLCCGELIKKTRDLESDRSCKSLLRWFKAPGSFVKEKNQRVIYMTFGVNDIGAIPYYTLSGMEQNLGITHTLKASDYNKQIYEIPAKNLISNSKGAPTKKKRKTPKGKGRGGEPFIMRARELTLIAAFRSGIKKGTRHQTILFYHQAVLSYLRKTNNKTAEREASDKAHKFNQQYCRPTLSDSECDKAINHNKRFYFKSQTVVDHLRITRSEIEAFGLITLISNEIKEEREAEKNNSKTAKKAKTQAIKETITKGGKDSEIASLFGVSRQYVHKLRKNLNLKPKPTSEKQAKLELPE